MSSDVERQVIENIQTGLVETEPFPHMYVEDIFPRPYYQQMRQHWPDDASLSSLADTNRVYGDKEHYRARSMLMFDKENLAGLPEETRCFWSDMQTWFLGKNLLYAILEKFRPHVESRFAGFEGKLHFIAQAMLVSDRTNFSVGPHTDVPQRVLSLLFYCPADDSHQGLGTSLYVPKEPGFTCTGGPHYERENFNLVKTMPFRPNTLFVFQRTDNSFHGVEPIQEEDIKRDLILFNVRTAKIKQTD
jgi:hypothetical protein